MRLCWKRLENEGEGRSCKKESPELKSGEEKTPLTEIVDFN